MMLHVPAVKHTVPNFRSIAGLGDTTYDCSTGDCIPVDLSVTPDPLQNIPLPPITPINIANSNGGLLANTPGTFNSSTTPTSTNWAALLQSIAGAGAAGSAIYRSTQSPSLIPGTNLVYNPSGGALVNSSGLSTAVSSGVSNLLPLLLIAGVAIAIFGKK